MTMIYLFRRSAPHCMRPRNDQEKRSSSPVAADILLSAGEQRQFAGWS
jgi:hypothetical protein